MILSSAAITSSLDIDMDIAIEIDTGAVVGVEIDEVGLWGCNCSLFVIFFPPISLLLLLL
jgi:hypothetical protein